MTAKNVLITGANKGIGLELCKNALEKGYKVSATCRQSSKELDALPLTVFDKVDVRDEESIKRIKPEIPSLDLLINNAGILANETFDNMDWQSISDQLSINAIGPIKCTSLLLSKMKDPSKVALVTSRMGSIEDNDSGGYYGYRMSKAALNAAGKSMSIDLKSKGIAVLIVHPGFVKTSMTGFNGMVTPSESASNIFERIDDLSLNTSGAFLHAEGSPLPW